MKMNFASIGIILLVIGLILFSGCTQNQENNTITIQNSKFNPDTLNIMAGTTVKWINNDSTPHTIVSDNGAFKNITINKGDNFQYIFYKEGTFNYHDSKNPSMTGKIIVTKSKGY